MMEAGTPALPAIPVPSKHLKIGIPIFKADMIPPRMGPHTPQSRPWTESAFAHFAGSPARGDEFW